MAIKLVSRLTHIGQIVIRRFFEMVKIYDVYQAKASKVSTPSPHGEEFGIGLATIQLDEKWMPEIVAVRPSYRIMAMRYFSENHLCLAIMSEGEIAAMGWLTKPCNKPTRLLRYYPLPANSAWLHADWTAPKWRGRGLHRRLIQDRAQVALASDLVADPMLECNIEPSNLTSIQNYKRLGFKKTGHMLVLRIPRLPAIAWRLK